MKIRTKLTLLASLPVVLLLSLTYVFVAAKAEMNRYGALAAQAEGIVRLVDELTVLTYEHYFYSEERAHQQWLAKYEVLGRELKQMEPDLDPAQREIVDRFQRIHRTIGLLFSQHGPRPEAGEAGAAGESFFTRVTARILQELAALAPAADTLLDMDRERASELSTTIDRQVFVLVGIITVGLMGLAVLVIRSLTVPVRTLQEAFARVSSGALDWRINSPATDELGDLSRSFDHMAQRLAESDSAWRLLNADLEQRVAERTEALSAANHTLQLAIRERLAAERSVRRNEERLAALLELSQMKLSSFEGLVAHALEQAVRLTGSELGYLHFYDSARQTMTLFRWSSAVLGVCKAVKTPHYPLSEAGVWADCIRQRQPVIHNDFPNLSGKKGYPEGHVALSRHMSLPIFEDNEIVAVVGVGNKATPYEEYDTRQLVFFLRSAWDIIRRRQAEDRLRDSEQRFRAIFDESPDGIVLFDRESGAVVDCNGVAHGQLGYEREEFCRLKVADYTATEGDTWWGRVEAEADFAFLAGFETLHRTKSGALRNVLVSAKLLALEERHYIYAIYRDVTDLRQAQEEVRFKAMLLDAATDSIFLVDSQGRIRYVNEAAYRTRGYSREELLAMSVMALDQPEFASLVELRLQRILEQGEAVFESGHRRKDGSFLPVEVNVRRIELHGEALFLASVRDISQQRESQEILRKYAMSLERSNKELEYFAYVASHDLQEPLRKIASFTELLARKYAASLDDKAAVYIGYIVDGAHRLQILINDLLSFSRVTTKGKPFSEVRCNAVVDRVLRDLELSIKESGACIEVGELPTVMADDVQLGQVMQNLIANAIKYRHTHRAPEIRVAAKAGDGEWVFSVRDNGIGIGPQYFERVFQLFQRLHTREEYSGTGIGLALCKKIVERHGGHIWVESEPEKGSTFYFSLPFTPPP